jgi:hypothetical protein
LTGGRHAVPMAKGEHPVTQEASSLTQASLKTPKAAAVAGIVFSVLLLATFWLFRASVPADPLEPGAWLSVGVGRVTVALNLIPFAGVAFLWFIGVLRDRLGTREDRFFATVFLGSGLLFLAMLFAAGAIIGAIIWAFTIAPEQLIRSATFHFARAAAYSIVNVYMIKVAAVFVITTSTVAIYTQFAPRWIALIGYLLAVLLVFGGYLVDWTIVAFPAWVLLLSLYILVDNLRQPVPAGGGK